VRFGRTLPPAVAPIGFVSIANGIAAMFTGAKSTGLFADQLKEYFKVKHCFLLSSGKASLLLILQAMKTMHPGRDEVLIPAFTCYSVPAAIVRAGLKVRICDIEPETLDFDYCELAEQLSCPRLLCVIPTHLFGVTADVARVREMIGNRDVAIIEDAAQSMGAKSNGCMVGTLGDVGFFSLGRGKAFSTVTGGIILTNSDEIGSLLDKQYNAVTNCSLAEQLILVMYAVALTVLTRPWLFWIPKSLPFLGLGETNFDPGFLIKKMSAFQAGLADEWQDRLMQLRSIRQRNADHLLKAGAKVAVGAKLLASGLIRFPIIVANGMEKQAVLCGSNRSGLGGADAYPGTVDGIAALRGCIVGGTSAKARSVVERLVTFPVHRDVTQKDMHKIAALLHDPKNY